VIDTEYPRIRVATLNCRDAGWTVDRRAPGTDLVVAAVAELGRAPDILCLSDAAGLRLHGHTVLLSLTQQLNELLTGDCYYPFLSDRRDSRNPPGLWLSARHVRVLVDHQLPRPGDPRGHTVEGLVAGRRLWLKAVHWRESSSPQGSVVQSALDGQLAELPTILAGHFGATPDGRDQRGLDWAERQTNKNSFDRLLRAGFWDAGQAAGDSRHTADRILVSHLAPLRLVPGSYAIGPTTGVACELAFAISGEDKQADAVNPLSNA
jgi:hypothetical protein